VLFHLWYQVFDGISKCNMCNNDRAYNISAYSLLCFIDQTPDCYLNIYSSGLCFIHQITITIQKQLLCVTQFQFFYMTASTNYNIQSVTRTQCNRQSARCQKTHTTSYFVARKFSTQSNNNLPITTPIQIHAWNIPKAEIIM
jgi:hypothetical protein